VQESYFFKFQCDSDILPNLKNKFYAQNKQAGQNNLLHEVLHKNVFVKMTLAIKNNYFPHVSV
jgi:hypothetical protein